MESFYSSVCLMRSIFSRLLRHLVSHTTKHQHQQGMNSIQGTSQKWENNGRRNDRPENVRASSQFSEQGLKALGDSLQALPDLEYNIPSSDPKGKAEPSQRASVEFLHDPISFAPEYKDFECRGEMCSIPYEEGPHQNQPVFEPCSPASSESSIDICFLKPVNFTTEPERTEHVLQPLPKKSCALVSGSSSSTYKRDIFRSKGKQLSRSLKEFPCSGMETISARVYSTRSSSGSRLHTKQERGFQSHLVSAPSRSSEQHNYFPPQRAVGEKPSFLEVRRVKDEGKPSSQQGLKKM